MQYLNQKVCLFFLVFLVYIRIYKETNIELCNSIKFLSILIVI